MKIREIIEEITDAKASKFGNDRDKSVLICFLQRYESDKQVTNVFKKSNPSHIWELHFSDRETERLILLQLINEDSYHLYEFYKKEME